MKTLYFCTELTKYLWDQKNIPGKKIVDKTETHALCPVQFYAWSYSL